ncbi:MAG: S-layer homology domain-containing protein, partial [Oscillospiraceae bacterium]
GGTTVKPATGETITIENSGKVVLPEGTTVTPGGGSASIVVNPTGDTELKPDGSVTFPNGGTVTVGGQTVTIPNGAMVDNMGNITLPANGTVTLPGGVTVTPAAGGKVVILPDGTVKLPQGGTKNPGATSVGAGGSVSIDGTVTQPSNPGGGGSGGGTVTPPAKSESVTITVKADGNGVATVDDAALKNALETAAKSGATTVVIDAGGKTIALTQPQLKMLADNKNIQNVEFKTPLYRLRLDKSAQMSVAAETKGKITVSFSDGMNLDPETKVQQGKAPVAEVTLTSENGAVTKLGGTGTIFFNYTLKAGETADMLTGLYLPKNATAQRLPARYDAKMKMAEVDTTHLSVFSFTFDTMRFSDVKGWASDYIYHLANRGVVKGVTADMYMPEANVTRSEFVTLLARMSGAKLPAGTTKFMDVAADAWYAPSVAWAVSAGITKGTGEGYFNPDMPISRQDMAAMLARYTQHMGKQPDKTAETMTFADAASIAPYAVEAVTLMQQAGVINGRDGGNFAPMANATRGECAKMMSALLYAID